MGWMQRLCDVYDVVSRIDIPEDAHHTQLVPVGFTKKKMDYLVVLTADGRFSSAHKLDDDERESKIKGKNSGDEKSASHKPGKNERECIVPTTPEAEGRTGAKGAPYPLAENIKYFAGEEGDPALLDRYLDQLSAWCAQPEAPECLKALLAYLKKRILLADLRNELSNGLKLHKDESRKDFAGPDGKAIICFTVEDSSERLWKRKDVQDSWSAYFARRQGGAGALCYVTGQMLPALDNHPKVQGNAKLISAKDAGYPFQYKGRFVEDRSAATVSAYASDRAHRALQYLMAHQGLSFGQFGLNIVAWEVQKAAAMYVPLHERTAEDEDEDEDDIALPDTFEGYARTLRDAVKGVGKTDRVFEKCIANLADGEERASSVVIMSMVAATDGRMSIDYYQELPDDLYLSRITDWYRSCCWTYKAKKRNVVRTPMPLSIASAVMGTENVRRAKEDRHNDNSDAKQLRALYKRLLKCIVEGAPLPRNFLESAVHRAEAPLTFHDSDGNWQRYEWETCIRTTCALIRRSHFDAQKQLPSAQLDGKNRNRDYLYGRLLALADQVEYDAADRPEQRKLPTNAIRLTQRFVQYPKETWLHLHAKLLPYFAALGNDDKADRFMRMIADVESLFERADRESAAALGEDFLLGYFAQRLGADRSHAQDVPNQGKEDRSVYAFGTDRSERFGMLAAVADFAERRATLEERGERIVSTHDGNTAALRLMVRLTQQPAATWAEIHAKLLPYLEKLGIRSSAYPIAMLCAIEEGFDNKARLDNTPLDSLFLHGFYRMRACLRSGGKAAREAQTAQDCPLTRNSAYALLLAIENRVERAVLDLEKREDGNRASNAVRFMNKFAVSPAATWRCLEDRMKPYLKKLRSVRTGWALSFKTRIDELNEAIRKNGWDSDQPLSAGWLHAYYTADKIIKKQERSA